MKKFISACLIITLLLGGTYSTIEASSQKTTPTAITKGINDAVYSLLDFSDEQELEFAKKGFIRGKKDLEIMNEDGKVIWSQKEYKFLEGNKAPDSVNPSLWRNTQLNHLNGLFKVTDGIYQVRGYDMTNITFVRGNTGWIVFDPLMSIECSKAALELVEEEFGKLPIMGIIISHPHVDHFGGIKGIISEEEAKERKVPIIVPDEFEVHAVSENIYAGNAMIRRAGYQYGTIAGKGILGKMSIGIGMGQSTGTISYISPTDIIKETGEIRTIDGINMEFQMTPGTECHAEMNTWFKDKKALWIAENCTGTLHNLYTMRGAEVRDGNAWARYIMEAVSKYGNEVEVVFQSHNWPHWGNKVIKKYMIDTAAMYKFINDQTLMYINLGYTSDEISNMIKLPKGLEKNWYTRQYYGTLSTNSKAVYQKYMGWYDANPAHLNPLTPTKKAKKFVEYLGDVNEVIKMAKEDYEKGEYQWVAEIMNIVVFANPKNQEARNLGAQALEQLAYQAESGTWRNAYLSGAGELRGGITKSKNTSEKAGGMDLIKNMTPEMMLDYLGILFNSNAAEDLNVKINLRFIDIKEQYLMTIQSGVILWEKGSQSDDAVATLTMPRMAMLAVLAKDKGNQDKFIKIDGDKDIITKLNKNMSEFDYFFNIIEPK